jgi:hypothetical protein
MKRVILEKFFTLPNVFLYQFFVGVKVQSEASPREKDIIIIDR